MQIEETIPAVSCEQAADLDGSRVMVEARHGDGKTEAAILRAARLVGDGVDPGSVLMVTATDEAASALARRLFAICPKGAGVRVCSAFSLAASLVCDPASDGGASVSVATAAQRSFLTVDALTAMQADDCGGQVSAAAVAEEASKAAMRYGLVLADGVYACALEALGSGRVPDWVSDVEFVIADDWDALGSDARRLCEAVAVRQCFAAGYPGSRFSSEGECVRVRLCVRQDASLRIRTFARCIEESDSRAHDDALRARTIFPDDDSVRIVKWRTAHDELEGMASLVKAVLSRHPDFAPSDVCIVVPNAAWAKAVRKVLYGHMLESTESVSFDPLAADPRRANPSGALASYVRLNLLAHPESPLSWRMWAGMGQRGLAARAWLRFEQWRIAQGLDFERARRRFCADQDISFDGADALRSSFAEAEAFMEQASGLRGFSLLSGVCPDGDEAFIRLASGVADGEGAAALCDRVSGNARFQRLDESPAAVRICSASHAAGLSFGAVIMAGAVDGLVPAAGSSPSQGCDGRQDQCALFCSAAAKAREELIISLFQKAPEQMAADFGMRIMRTKMENGQRFAMLRPSPFIARAGNAAPGAESAEQFVALG